MAGEVFLTDNISIRNVTPAAAAAFATAAAAPAGTAAVAPVPLRASLRPNPLQSSAVLRFATSRPGALRIDLFDLSGRRVRQLLDSMDSPAGVHELRIEVVGDAGGPLSPGIYYYRIQAREGVSDGRLLVVR